MELQEVFSVIRPIISESLDIDLAEISMDKSFRGDLDADSLDSVEIVMAIEEAFNVTLSEEAAASVETVGDLVKHVVDALAALQAECQPSEAVAA